MRECGSISIQRPVDIWQEKGNFFFCKPSGQWVTLNSLLLTAFENNVIGSMGCVNFYSIGEVGGVWE